MTDYTDGFHVAMEPPALPPPRDFPPPPETKMAKPRVCSAAAIRGLDGMIIKIDTYFTPSPLTRTGKEPSHLLYNGEPVRDLQGDKIHSLSVGQNVYDCYGKLIGTALPDGTWGDRGFTVAREFMPKKVDLGEYKPNPRNNLLKGGWEVSEEGSQAYCAHRRRARDKLNEDCIAVLSLAMWVTCMVIIWGWVLGRVVDSWR